MIKIERAEILCVGTEILIGDIVNTNAAFLSKKLAQLGFAQYHQSVVGDNPARLKEDLKHSLSRSDLIIMTGGLGPTYDDLTKECVAELFGKSMYLHLPSLERIRSFFNGRGIDMPPTNEKQALVPVDSVVFKNDNGTAPGVGICDEENGKIVIMLPGPPREMAPMFENEVMPFLRKFATTTLVSRNIHIVGMGESQVEYRLRDRMRAAVNPTIAPYCIEGEVRIRVTARAATEEQGLALCDEEIARIRETEVGQYIYGIDTDLEHAVYRLLSEKGKTLSTAESCTGGLIAKRLTDIPGSSSVFISGTVTYSYSSKENFLGVRHETLMEHGAVSELCAKEMAEGIRRVSGSDIGISVTGVAGPGGGTKEKPVGTVWCAIAMEDRTVTKLLNLSGSREHIRNLTATSILSFLLSLLRK